MIQKILLFTTLLSLTGCFNASPKTMESEPTEISDTIPADPVDDKRIRMNTVAEGKPAPEGTLLSMDSTAVSLQSFRGRLLVMDFWATWCGPCLKETPAFHALGKKYAGKNVRFISVSIDDEFDYWRDFVLQKGWEGENYWLGAKEDNPLFAFTYTEIEIDSVNTVLIGLPKYVFVSEEGEILHNFTTKPSTPEFEEILKQYVR